MTDAYDRWKKLSQQETERQTGILRHKITELVDDVWIAAAVGAHRRYLDGLLLALKPLMDRNEANMSDAELSTMINDLERVASHRRRTFFAGEMTDADIHHLEQASMSPEHNHLNDELLDE